MEFKGGKALFYSCMFTICAALYFIMDNIFRSLWFDEALTLSEFMIRNTIPGIYLSYEIPNNHIVFNIFLKIWMLTYEQIFGISDFSFRTFTAVTSIVTLCAILILWRRHAGLAAITLTVLCFITTPAFEIYSVAIRGYILCFLMTVLAFESCRRLMKNFSFLNIVLFFILCVLSVGIMPTAIIPLTAIIIYFAPLHDFKKLFSGKFITVALIPLTALIVFYLPIANKFLRIFSLNEGWEDKSAALLSTYMPFIIGMAPILIAALIGVLLAKRNRISKTTVIKFFLILSIPACSILLANPAPFPRVFFPMWPIFLLFAAMGLRLALIQTKNRSCNINIALIVILLLSIPAWSIVQRKYSKDLSLKCTQAGALDDYFSPYYMSKFNPAKVAAAIKALGEDQKKTISAYVTFNADPYSVALYGRLYNIPEDIIIYDSPRRKILINLTDLFLVIAKNEEDAADIRKRLNLGELELLKDCGYQKIYAEKTAAITLKEQSQSLPAQSESR